MFDPKTNLFPYPEITDGHYLEVKKNNGAIIDENYPYVDLSKPFLLRQAVVRALLYICVFPASYIRMGLKIEGRENLRKHKEIIDKGVISCANHVHMWDYIAVMNAIKPRKSYILVWKPNVTGESGTLVRLVGGIPIPENDANAAKAYLSSVNKLLDGGWLHICPEGSMWEYYQPIRPFKRGAAYLACECGKPLLPMAFSYREPGFIRKRLFGQIACFTLKIGEPLFPDESLPKRKRVDDLTKRAHAEVCRLAGIDPEKNLYPPIFKNSKRVDYYTSEYGKNYKGSH